MRKEDKVVNVSTVRKLLEHTKLGRTEKVHVFFAHFSSNKTHRIIQRTEYLEDYKDNGDVRVLEVLPAPDMAEMMKLLPKYIIHENYQCAFKMDTLGIFYECKELMAIQNINTDAQSFGELLLRLWERGYLRH
jgi:hypothetical protein